MQDTRTAKSALERTIKAVKARPEFGQRTYTATATLENGMTCAVTEKNHNLIADLPTAMGGDNEGPSPGALLRCAMASCVAIGIKSWAIRSDLTINCVDVRFEADSDARGELGICDAVAPGFEAGRLHIRVVSPDAPDAVRDAIKTSLTYSPLMDAVHFRTPIEVETQIIPSVNGMTQ